MRPEYCPHCGAEVPERAKVCPECGSSEETGWSDEAHVERLGLPSQEFDYDQYVKEEFGAEEKRSSPKKLILALVALFLIGLILAAYLLP